MSVISSVMKQQKGGRFEIIANKFVQKSTLLALLVGTLLLLLVSTECVASNPISAPINSVVGSTNNDEIGRQSGSYNNLGKFKEWAKTRETEVRQNQEEKVDLMK